LSSPDIVAEQGYVSMLYGRLDRLREEAAGRLPELLRWSGGSPQAVLERDVAAAGVVDRIGRLNAAEHGLCFGRLDFADGERHYVGRLGIADDDHEPLLIDWRAPAARSFYLATGAAPGGVRRRRHIRTRLRRVTGLEDEVLDLAGAAAGPHQLTGEAALLAALSASRTGRMSDIVETIQAEQDAVIRAAQDGVLVVQGGPGTGKTAVALHRAAYLLYTHREKLARRGVLIIGPNATFLRYIGQVLPSLGETSALLAAVEQLYPGMTADRTEPAEVAEIKGRAQFADVLAAAVADRQTVPAGGLTVPTGGGETLWLDEATCRRARAAARRTGLLHNEAAAVFADAMLDALTAEAAQQLAEGVPDVEELLAAAGLADDDWAGDPAHTRDLIDAPERSRIRAELAGDPAVRAAIAQLWPVLTPAELLADLFADPARLATAAPGLPAAERAALRRDPGGWTPADVPLLDEAAELLGVDQRAERAQAQRQQQARLRTAQGVLDILTGSASHELDDLDPVEREGFTAAEVMDAELLAERHRERDDRSVAQRAAADRTWTFGHVIVDEAQELSAMAWRLVMRRCPNRSMTVLGDLAQTGDLAGAASWAQVLDPYVAGRWRLARLTVNYRTPAEIMAVAAASRTDLEPVRSVRSTGVPPWRAEVSEAELPGRLAAAAAAEAAAVGDGRLAVLVPADRFAAACDAVGSVLPAAVAGAAGGGDPDLDNPVVVLTVRQAKGLEFDSVLVVDPDGIAAGSPRGPNDRYVALTRATQRLGVLQPVPAG
jgi:DNA helicase IV